jgi:hypothetical protein
LDDEDRDQAIAAIVELIMAWWREHTDPPLPETTPPHRGHQPTGR